MPQFKAGARESGEHLKSHKAIHDGEFSEHLFIALEPRRTGTWDRAKNRSDEIRRLSLFLPRQPVFLLPTNSPRDYGWFPGDPLPTFGRRSPRFRGGEYEGCWMDVGGIEEDSYVTCGLSSGSDGSLCESTRFRMLAVSISCIISLNRFWFSVPRNLA